jgi:ATP-dependent helicase/nuclease subunit B
MHIIFGRSFAGGSYPTVLDGCEASAGTLHLGPAGLLARLEQSLGIPTPSGHRPVRVAEYAKRLALHDKGSWFYSASRQADPWRVARKLLSLRDELVLAGWKVQRPKGMSRLSVFAELEEMKTAPDYPLSPGDPDRLLRVLSRLEVLPTGIDRIELIDDPEFLPKLWRDLFQRMAKAGTQISRRQESCAEADGDLGKGQKTLQGNAAGEVRGDGSLLRLENTGVVEAAEATCAYLRSLLKKVPPEAIVLIRDGDPRAALVLETAMRAFDIPSVGLSLDSSHRPATQILPLFLGLSWEPVDPDLLVEFLTLPSSPVPAEARRRLRESLNVAPGYQSHAWCEARQRAIEEIRSKYGAERASEADREIKQWLDDVKRTPLRSEMLVTDAIRLVGQVESWANRRAHAEEAAEPFFAQAKQQAALMLRLLELHPRPSIGKSEIGRLVLDVLQSGICHELNHKETDSIRVVSSPAAIFGAARHVIWWQCIAASADVPAPLFWTKDEVEFLKRSGCEIPSPTNLLLDHARAWRRPVLCAKKTLLMVQPCQAFSEPAESHPIWNEITAAIAADDAAKAKISISAAELLSGTVATLEKPTDTIEVTKLNLPAPKRVWQLPPCHIAPPPFASPSSLEKMLACPLQWVLQYKAGLRKPLIEVLNAHQLLYGNFAHWLVGEYLRDFIGKELPKPDQAAAEIGRRFDALVESEAAPLAKPGMDREKTYVRERLVRAIRSLVNLLHQGDYRVASIEQTHNREFLLGGLEGRTDLTVRRATDGKTAVIDLKWSSEGRKRDSLKSGTAFQLAAYSYLTRDREKWPPTAYFLFPTAQLYSTSEDGFPGSMRVTGPSDHEVWEAAMTLTRETKTKLDGGAVEVLGLEEKNGSSRTKQGAGIMELEAPCEYCDFKLFCSHP